MIHDRLTQTGRWSQLVAPAESIVMCAAVYPAIITNLAAQIFIRLIVVSIIVMVAAACAQLPKPADRLVLKAAAFSDLLGWGRDSIAEVIPALLKSCAHFENLPADQSLGVREFILTVGDLHEPCRAATNLQNGDDAAVRAYFEKWFRPFLVTNNGKKNGLFTGYFEVGLEGRLTADSEFKVPLYRLPDDHVVIKLGDFDVTLAGHKFVGRVEGGKLKPYPPRDKIDAGGLAGRGLELVWVRNTVDAFMFHVQGSGRITLSDGSIVHLGFAGDNGRNYRSIGRELIDQGELTLKQASWPGIRDWIDNNPNRAASILAVNRRYIFFREIRGGGPIGAEGVKLTAGRSLAVDTRFLPLGLPLWLDTQQPGHDARPLRRLMMAQDTGNAIRSPVRGDFFWGFGHSALALAGRMRSQGSYYLFLPRIVAGRLKNV